MTRVGQRGVALLSVLLITSLALMVIGSLLRNHRLALQGTAQQVHEISLRQAALAVEGHGVQLLQGIDWQEARTTHLAQAWAIAPKGFRLPDIGGSLNIEDLGGRFNLTRLTAPGGPDDVHAQRWSRLLDTLGIAPFDLAPLQGLILNDTSQLHRISGLRKSDLQRLLPWVAVLPKDAVLNVNTAPAQVLASLEGMTPGTALSLARHRPAQGYADAASFTRVPGVEGLGLSTHGLGVSSRWFRITAQVSVADRQLTLVTDIERVANTQRVRILQRRLLPSTQEDAL